MVAQDAQDYGFIESTIPNNLKIEDLADLYIILDENYPYFNVYKIIQGKSWLENKKKHKRMTLNFMLLLKRY